MSKSAKEPKQLGYKPAKTNLEVKPDTGKSHIAIDHANKKILMRVSTGCRRDTNPEIDGGYQKAFNKAGGKGKAHLSRYDGVSEPYLMAKLGRKPNFTYITFLVGPHHKKCLGFEGVPTDAAIAKALKDPTLLRYEWTGELTADALVAGKEVFDLDAEGVAVQMGVKVSKPKAAKVIKVAAEAKKSSKPKAAKKPAKKKVTKVAAEAKESGAVKKPAKKQIWYQMVGGKITKKRMVKQPEGFFPSEKEAKLNRVVVDAPVIEPETEAVAAE